MPSHTETNGPTFLCEPSTTCQPVTPDELQMTDETSSPVFAGRISPTARYPPSYSITSLTSARSNAPLSTSMAVHELPFNDCSGSGSSHTMSWHPLCEKATHRDPVPTTGNKN